MKNSNQFEGKSDMRKKYAPLAKWLEQLLTNTTTQMATSTTDIDDQFLVDYHPRFYQQLPDFIAALLDNDPQAAVHYAPLLYHLVGCAICRSAYLELYDAMHAARQPDEVYIPSSMGTASYATTPPRMVMRLCQLLINQAETVKRQAHRDHTNNNELARSLLQQSLEISKHLTQDKMRQQALHDLVRVATLFEDSTEQSPAAEAYSPRMATGSSARHASPVRRIEAPPRHAGPPVIPLLSNTLEGSISQNGNTLELHLQGLDAKLRGHYLTINIPLGSLLEPVRWNGGNPRSIRSTARVDEHGTLHTELGQTDLRLDIPEEYNLLEAMFWRLEVRIAD